MKLLDENLTEIVPECEQNGAGPKGFGFLVPDKLGLVDVYKAGSVHDCHYHIIKNVFPLPIKFKKLKYIERDNNKFWIALESKESAIKYANEAFYKNLKIINKSKSPTRLGYIMRKPIIWAYYKAVTKFGRYFL